jgi:DNA-binding transcriptional MocR family regulator
MPTARLQRTISPIARRKPLSLTQYVLPPGNEELFRQALRNKISLGPGTLFSATDRYRNCIRMGCAEPWSRRVQEAVANLGDLARKQLCLPPHSLRSA